jgi:hypothetical protein
MKAKKISLLSISMLIYTVSLGQFYSAEELYINSVFYFNRLSVMRTSYDRWDKIFKEYKAKLEVTGEDEVEFKSAYSAIIDATIIYSRDLEGTAVGPQTIGFAAGNTLLWNTLGYYFLFHTSDIRNLTTWDRELWSSGPYNAFTLGAHLDFYHLSIQSDITRVNKKHWFYYGKAYIPLIKTHLGVSLSNYETFTDSSRIMFGIVNERFRETDTYNVDKFDLSTTIFKFFNFGFRYYSLLKAKYVPNINFSLHQFYDIEKHYTMPIDIEFFFETRGQKLKNIFNLKDYEVRVCTYIFTGKGKKGEHADLVWRSAFFVAGSYKSPEDGFTHTLTESGKIYTGQHGWGGEIGWGYRILGFQKYGFPDNTFFKYSLYYNYSQYFERIPGIEWGMKCRVLI